VSGTKIRGSIRLEPDVFLHVVDVVVVVVVADGQKFTEVENLLQHLFSLNVFLLMEFLMTFH
jgi:hypothetical protein